MIACAQTGTGKTAAFILPLLHNLQAELHAEDKVNAIIMAPTRELAQQLDQQMEGFCYFTSFSSVAVYGGNDSQAWDVQRRGLQKGADVVIATDDNPRNENPVLIMKDIVAGFEHPEAVTIEHDRAAAIRLAIQQAKAGDVVLVAGKGHEQEQIIAGVAHAFDDREQIRLALSALTSEVM